ncbi:MAG: hypothetical protein ACRDHY_06545 [Anaerolineales bacterium]
MDTQLTLERRADRIAVVGNPSSLEAWPEETIGDRQAEMSLVSFRLGPAASRRAGQLPPDEAFVESQNTPPLLRVDWSGPCPYCAGDRYRERVVPCGNGWRYQGECAHCGTRRFGYRSGTASPA